MRSHDWIDRRSLALHEAVAAKLEEDPAVLEQAKLNVQRWLVVGRSAAIVEWQRLVAELSRADLVRLLRATDERATRLRQSSPFAGVLSAGEQRQILRKHDAPRA